MKLSVSGFKSIQSLENFELRDVNILAGTNSSGKSSLTQALLLLKQTIESDSKETLRLNGPYVFANNLVDLLYMKQKSTLLEYDIRLDRSELVEVDRFDMYVPNDTFEYIDIHLSFVVNGSVHVQDFSVNLVGANGDSVVLFIKRNKGTNYTARDYYQVVTSDAMVLGVFNAQGKKMSLNRCVLDFTNFFPIFGECLAAKSNVKLFSFPLIKLLKLALERVFNDIFYIGPIRVKPALLKSYDVTPSMERVDADGDNTRYILQENKSLKVDGEKTLLETLNDWVCNKLRLANRIDTVKDANKFYRTQLQNDQNLKVDLCHMGFGVSQVLPIFVQGLILPNNSIFIVEDPCVHMHPSIQAMMMDFLLDVANRGGCKVLIETHSDHIITRLRRRVAEGYDAKKVNLRFVTPSQEGSIYKKIDVTSQGAFTERLPDGFLDTQDEDFRAILKSRIRK